MSWRISGMELGSLSKDWSDLWLSEGVSAFLADAFLGQRFGKESYEREIEHSRQIYNQLRAEGKDRSLSDTGWTTHQEADGEIPEHKGAWFLYLVTSARGRQRFLGWVAIVHQRPMGSGGDQRGSPEGVRRRKHGQSEHEQKRRRVGAQEESARIVRRPWTTCSICGFTE